MKLGSAFSDNLESSSHTKVRNHNEEAQLWWAGKGRVLIFLTLFCIAFFILAWRLFDVTMVRGYEYRQLADGNRTRELIRRAPRGLLFDRTGKPLVTNIPFYILRFPCTEAQERLCSKELTDSQGQALLASGLTAGQSIERVYRRVYTDATALSHFIGYTSEISETELSTDYFMNRQYHPGDRVGRTGVEEVFEETLRGRDGRELVEVDATGATLRTLGREHEIAGSDITLSLDFSLQKAIAAHFPQNQKGAVIVSKPTTGEILGMYSSPSFDVNAFSSGISQSEYEALQTSTDMPMFDRAIAGVYPPGSTFKIVTALAALEEKVIDKKTEVEDVGVLTIGAFTFPNWYYLQYGKTDGQVDVVKALQRSNDIYFYKTGEWLGITKLERWASKVGIGKLLGIELAGEASGLMPNPTWKKNHFSTPQDRAERHDEWYVGDTYHVSIGQGYLLTTPLQVNAWTNLIANNGSMCRPTIKKSSNECKSLNITKATIQVITQGMVKACEPGGTGWPLFNFGVPPKGATTSSQLVPVSVACKTGTAEFGDPKNHTHAWFTAFAPSDAPEVSVTVLVEGAGEGSSVAAPVAKKILEEWFGR